MYRGCVPSAGRSGVLGTSMDCNPLLSSKNPRVLSALQGSLRQYQPTITPSGLMPDATVTTAPGTSILVVTSGRLADAGITSVINTVRSPTAVLRWGCKFRQVICDFLQELFGLGLFRQFRRSWEDLSKTAGASIRAWLDFD